MNGYRLLVPAIWLWFHADDAAWGAVEQALASRGIKALAEGASLGCEGEGFAVEYRPESRRLSVELTHEAGQDAAAALAAVALAAGDPEMETGNCWLWSPKPFSIRGARAEAAQRVLAAARWVLPRERTADTLGALVEETHRLPQDGSLSLHLATVVRLEIHVPEMTAVASWPIFQRLIAALGEPDHKAHVTIAA